MKVRTYLILLISVVALGALALVGGLNSAFQDLELERERQIQSSTAVDHLAYVKEDLGRLTTIGDLIFGASKGFNSYLAQPAISQLKQINDKLEEINQHIDLEHQQTEKLNKALAELHTPFNNIYKGKAPEMPKDQYDHL